MNKTLPTVFLALSLLCAPASAAPGRNLEELEHTILNLVDALVEQGVLSREKADAIKAKAASEAKAAREPGAGDETRAAAAPVPAPEPEPDPDVIRVPYVPEFVKEEIRAQVRSELRADVVEDVLRQARTERWGVPDALPEWISRFRFHGDVRLRLQQDLFSEDNAPLTVPDFNAINEAGGITRAGADAFLNTTEDRSRLRVRGRFGVDVAITEQLDAGFRVTTGNQRDPVSTNQTLGNTGRRFDVSLDRLFLRYDGLDADGYRWLTLQGGRIGNPFFSTDLVYDDDLGFEGAAITLRRSLAGGGSLFALTDRSSTLFFTAGAFPLQEVELSSEDKWLFGGQIGHEFEFENQSRTKLALAYYRYRNVAGRRNEPFSTLRDFTAPQFLQKGNTLFDIRNDADPGTNLFALASDFEILNLTGQVTLTHLAPIQVTLTGDVAKNFGFDEQEVLARTGVRVPERSLGYSVKLEAGWPRVEQRGTWSVFLGYRYLQRDAVLDAFTDSDFHLGGTDTEGWLIGGRYALTRNAVLRARWMSSNEIDGPPLGIDILQVDLNARF